MTPTEFRQFADLLPEPALMVNGDGAVLACNAAFRSRGLLTPTNLPCPITDLVVSDHQSLRQYLRDCARTRNMVLGAVELRCTVQGTRWKRCQGGALEPRSEHSPALIMLRLFSREISNAPFEAVNLELAEQAKSRYAQVLKRKSEQLQRSNADLQQFAYVASHDLQEPLRAVAAYCQLLQSRYADRLDDQARRYIEHAVDGATRMRTLILDLLEYSRVESRGAPLRLVSSREALERAVSNLKVAIRETNAVIEAPPLPSVFADENQLTRLFQNLIANAIKYRADAVPKIIIACHADEQRITFSIRDNGIGIAAAHFERIFEIFQRLHTRNQYPGTGIGLAICNRIVERHGGKIWVESSSHDGSTFCFTLPQIASGT